MISKVILVLLILLPFSIQAQSKDSTNTFTNFFGSDCPIDTAIVWLDKNDYCVFISKEFKIYRLKNKRLKWEVDLSQFSSCDYICLFERLSDSKKRNKTQVFILGFNEETENERMLIQLSNGKIIN